MTMSTRASKVLPTTLLLLTAATAFYAMFLCPTAKRDLFPAFATVKGTGAFPDGTPLRTRYSGVRALDRTLTALAGFFSLVVDGRDPATYAFGAWFLPQLGPLMVCLYGATGARGVARYPTVFLAFMQLFTSGVFMSLFFAALVLGTSSSSTNTSRAFDAKRILPAIALGFYAPSLLLFASPALGLDTDTRQRIAAAWQFFPAYIWLAFRVLPASPSSPAEAKNTLVRAYKITGALCAGAHVSILLSCVLSGSTLDAFVPPYLRAAQSTPVAPFRLALRVFFMHDWVTTTVAQLMFFVWARSNQPGFGRWIGRFTGVAIIGGPGAAFAWAGIEREEMEAVEVHAKNA